MPAKTPQAAVTEMLPQLAVWARVDSSREQCPDLSAGPKSARDASVDSRISKSNIDRQCRHPCRDQTRCKVEKASQTTPPRFDAHLRPCIPATQVGPVLINPRAVDPNQVRGMRAVREPVRHGAELRPLNQRSTPRARLQLAEGCARPRLEWVRRSVLRV